MDLPTSPSLPQEQISASNLESKSNIVVTIITNGCQVVQQNNKTI